MIEIVVVILTNIIIFLSLSLIGTPLSVLVVYLPICYYLNNRYNTSLFHAALIGFLGFFFSMLWLFSGLITNYGIICYVLSVLYHSILSGSLVVVAYIVINRKYNNKLFVILLTSLFATFVETFKEIGPISFPASISLSEAGNAFFMDIASIVGYYGVHYTVISINLLMTYILLSSKEYFSKIMVILFVIMLVIICYDTNNRYIITSNKSIYVSIVQPSIPIENIRNDNVDGIATIQRLISQSDAKLIVIPEGFAKLITLKSLNDFKSDCQLRNINLLININDVDMQYRKIYNSVALIETNGNIWQYYHKKRTVPLAEDDYTPYNGYDSQIEFQHIGISVNICFESLFQSIGNETINDNTKLYAVLADDAGMLGYTLPYLHLKYSQYRASENGVYTIHASQAGPSAFITPDGSIITASSISSITNLSASIPIMRIRTWYNIFGKYVSSAIILWVILYLTCEFVHNTCVKSKYNK
jgi:apolipoprotein N-acyltransferase